MSNKLSVEQIAVDLTDHFSQIEVPQTAFQDDYTTEAARATAQMILAQVSGGILSLVSRYLADNADILPPKEAIKAAVNKAIDAALERMNRPILTALISNTVKTLIANAVDSLYEAILNPPTTTPPTTEV